MEIENRIKSYREYGKGRYAYSTERRRIVWEDVMWPLFSDLNKPYFTLVEYHNKRNQVCKNRNHICGCNNADRRNCPLCKKPCHHDTSLNPKILISPI